MNNMKNIYYISFLSAPIPRQETRELPEIAAVFRLLTG